MSLLAKIKDFIITGRPDSYANHAEASAYLQRRWQELGKLPPLLDELVEEYPEGVLKARLPELVRRAGCFFDFPVPNVEVTIAINGARQYPFFVPSRKDVAIPVGHAYSFLKNRIAMQEKHLTPVYGPLIKALYHRTIDHYF